MNPHLSSVCLIWSETCMGVGGYVFFLWTSQASPAWKVSLALFIAVTGGAWCVWTVWKCLGSSPESVWTLRVCRRVYVLPCWVAAFLQSLCIIYVLGIGFTVQQYASRLTWLWISCFACGGGALLLFTVRHGLSAIRARSLVGRVEVCVADDFIVFVHPVGMSIGNEVCGE